MIASQSTVLSSEKHKLNINQPLCYLKNITIHSCGEVLVVSIMPIAQWLYFVELSQPICTPIRVTSGSIPGDLRAKRMSTYLSESL